MERPQSAGMPLEGTKAGGGAQFLGCFGGGSQAQWLKKNKVGQLISRLLTAFKI